MSNYVCTGEQLTSIADAIRTKGGTSEGLVFPDGFTEGIANIPVLDTSDATATAGDIRSGKNAYVNGVKIDGSLVPLDTSDATATSGDIKNGKKAYIASGKVTGSYIPTITLTTSSAQHTVDYTVAKGIHTPGETIGQVTYFKTQGTRCGIVSSSGITISDTSKFSVNFSESSSSYNIIVQTRSTFNLTSAMTLTLTYTTELEAIVT